MDARRTGGALLGVIAIALMVSVVRLRAEAGGGCSQPDATIPVRVRASSPDLREALRSGIRRSPLLASLVRRIEASDGFVYLHRGGLPLRNAGRLLGGLSHDIVAGPDYRLLTIVVWQQPGDQMICTVAHELRHALEVLDAPEAVDQLSVKQLYDRIGLKIRSSVYETDAAERVGERVKRELARCRS